MADFQEAANNAPPLEYSEAAPMERVTSRRMGRVPSRFRNTKEADVVKPTVNGEEESRRQSMKFSAKAFITKFAGDLEKYYEIGELLGKNKHARKMSLQV